MSTGAAETADILVAYVRDELLGGKGPTDLEAGDDLLGSGLVDSLGVMRLIGFIEQRLGVTVPPADVTIDHFMTVERIVDYLESRGD
ncbi:MAG: acyl carrier protein [Phycisphaerales bacterium]